MTAIIENRMNSIENTLSDKSERREFFIRATDYLRHVHGIQYGAQANKIRARVKSMTVPRMKNIRSDRGGMVYPNVEEVRALVDIYDLMLRDFLSDYFSPTEEEIRMKELEDRIAHLEAIIAGMRPEYLKKLRKKLDLEE